MIHGNVWLAVLVPSVTVTTTVKGLEVESPLETVPVMRPVLELMFSPGGRPVAE